MKIKAASFAMLLRDIDVTWLAQSHINLENTYIYTQYINKMYIYAHKYVHIGLGRLIKTVPFYWMA